MRYALLIIIAFALGCETRTVPPSRENTAEATTVPATRQVRDDLTLEDFRTLHSTMTLEELYAEVGRPQRDIGSGIYILEYVLSDRSAVYVGSSGQSILYVRRGSVRGEDLLPATGEP